MADIYCVINISLYLYFEDPLPSLVTVIAGLLAVAIFAILNVCGRENNPSRRFCGWGNNCFNYLYGQVAIFSPRPLVLVSWSRIVLEWHTIVQVSAGILVSI